MTIAEQIKASHSDENHTSGLSWRIAYRKFLVECEDLAVSVGIDNDHASTTYLFADDSVIVWCNNKASTCRSLD